MSPITQRLNRRLIAAALHLLVPREEEHIRLLETSVVTLPDEGQVSRA